MKTLNFKSEDKMIKLCAFSDEAASSLTGQIQALKRNGITLTELRSVDGKNVKDLTIDEAKAINQNLKDEGISVWSVGSPLGKADINVNFKEYLNEVKHVCELACALSTDKIRMFSFFNAYNQRNKVFDYLSEMVEVSKTFGVQLYHENEKDIYGDTAERVLDIMNNVNGLKYVYDPANFLQVGEKASVTLDLLHSKTDYFHIKDAITSTGELVPAGYGDGQIQKLIEMIKDDKVLTVEPHLAVFDAYASIDNTQLKTRFVYKNSNEAFDAAVTALKDLIKRV